MTPITGEAMFAIGMPGPMELGIILVIVMIFFGIGKLPKVLGEMGKGVKAFKDGMNEGDEDARRELDVTDSSKASMEAEEVARTS